MGETKDKDAYQTPVPPPTPTIDAVWERAQRHYFDTGERRVYVTPQEFADLRREFGALEKHKMLLGLLRPPPTGQIGDYLGFAVVVGDPPVSAPYEQIENQ